MKEKYTVPIYQKIALDLAHKIHTGELVQGSTLYGRSVLAAKYNVSPETIRRSIKLLEDIDIVKSIKGKGVLILSSDSALSFIDKYKDITDISSYKSNLYKLLEEKSKIDSNIMITLNKILDYSDRLEVINPLIPIQFKVESHCKHIGKTLAETKFWQNTGATLVGIKRGDELIISPGPYIVFMENDILLVVGDRFIYNSMPIFLYD